MSFGSTLAAAAMPRIVARSKPTSAKCERAAARILSRVPPDPGRRPVRATERLSSGCRRQPPVRSKPNQLGKRHQQKATGEPGAQHGDWNADAAVVEVERAPHRA